jgi:hypothetical protein
MIDITDRFLYSDEACQSMHVPLVRPLRPMEQSNLRLEAKCILASEAWNLHLALCLQ